MNKEEMNKYLSEHKDPIGIFQMSLISSVATLIYSEYISRMKQKQLPTRKILVPNMKEVRDYTDLVTPFMEKLADTIISTLKEEPLFDKIKDSYKILDEDMFDSVLRLYILPNVSRVIPNTISKKFGLEDDSIQMIKVDRDIRIFYPDKILIDDMIKVVSNQLIGNLILANNGIRLKIHPVESNISSTFKFDKNSIIGITNSNSISPLIYTKGTFDLNPYFVKLFNFVSSSKFEFNNNEVNMSTGVLNTVTLYEVME